MIWFRKSSSARARLRTSFWIACGGSMIDLMPANELLKREATTFTSTVYTAREFCLMAPKSLGEKSLVIACSHSGNTQEVVDGCEMALAAGAEVVAPHRLRGLQDRQRQVDHPGLPWGEGRAAGRGASGHRRSDRRRAARPAGRLRGTRRHVRGPKADGCAAARRPREGQRRAGRPLCRALSAAQVLLYPGSGPNFSQTYAMAICSLMEMQWQHCCYIHSGEYFHGPFEATEPGVFYFVQLGSGECRPMEERALAFLNTHTDTVMVLDALASTAWARCPPACVRTWSRYSSTT